MKKIKVLLIGVLAILCGVFAIESSNVIANVKAADEPTPYTLSFSDSNLSEKVTSVYIPTAFGKIEEFSEHWSVEGDTLTRINDCGTDDVTGSYAVNYLNGCYFKYFELTTKIKYGESGLAGIVFGKKDIMTRHLADGNALYIMSDVSIEIAGTTITQKVTSSKFAQKNDYYDLTFIVCEDYVKVTVDGIERIFKTLPSELFEYGRIGLFTANTDGSFKEDIYIYNLDEHGNRIALEEYTPTTGIEVTTKTVDLMLSDEDVTFKYNVLPATATVKDVRFLSVSPDIAVVDTAGYIHPLKAGVTEIQVITLDGGFKDSFIVNVTEIIPELEGITIDKTEATIKVGSKLYLSASSYPEEAENLGFKWNSSDTKVAIVNGGTVTAMSEGTCTITVKDYYGHFVARCTVTVTGDGTVDQTEKKGCKSSLDLGVLGVGLAIGSLIKVLKRRNG